MYYKVVVPVEDRLTSAIARGSLELEYYPNEWVYPWVANSKLFVFDTLHHAQQFANRVWRYNPQIWECEVINPEPLRESVSPCSDITTIGKFWADSQSVNTKPTPYHTVVCDAVKLTSCVVITLVL